MNDLLSKAFSRSRDGGDPESGAVEMQGLDSSGYLAPFFEEVNVIENDMERVKQLLEKLQDANEEGKTITKAAAMKALRDRMEQDVREVTKIAKSIKDKLERLDKANIDSRKAKGHEEGTPTDRTRMSITNSLRKKLAALMQKFTILRDKISAEYKDTIERRYYTVTGNKPDAETLDHIIETGESETFLQKAIQEQGRGQVIDTIREIQERHDGVKEIEKNLLELHQIFLDMAVLVEAQGEQMNDIEANVNRAQSFVAGGTAQLHIAKRHQRNTRKWTCCCIILLLIIALIVTLVVLSVTKVI
jgi:syntaxin 1B/2/3